MGWVGLAYHLFYLVLTRQLRAMGEGTPLLINTLDKGHLTKGFSGNRNPFLDELKSSPQDSAHGQSLIYCQKKISQLIQCSPG
jgi:hypothetical protein